MKKESVASSGFSKTEFIVRKLSTFDAILGEVIFCLIFFIGFLQTNVSAVVPNTSSLLVSWSRPQAAYVTAVNAANNVAFTNRCSGVTQCVLGGFWGTPNIRYYVHTGDYQGNVLVSDTCQTTKAADGSGQCTIKWTWGYEVQVYPSRFSSCSAAVLECKVRNVSNNNSDSSEVFGDLQAGTNYARTVCTPNCYYGAIVLLDRSVDTTGTPAANLNQNVATGCNGYGRVNVDFSWTKASGRTYSEQYLDLSFDPNFSASQTSGTQLSSTATTYSRGDVVSNVTYYWRINSHIANTNAWDVSVTKNFTTPACSTAKGAALDNPIYMSCTNLGQVNIYFSWVGASGANYTEQWLDYSTVDSSFTNPANFTGIKITTAATNGKFGFGLRDQNPNQKFYWRVNSLTSTGTWVLSTPSFVAIQTPTCSATLPSGSVNCSIVDVNHDGVVNGGDQGLIEHNFSPPAIYNASMDFNTDKVVDYRDELFMQKYLNKRCSAGGLTYTSTCDTTGIGGAVITTLKWAPANADTYKTQIVDWDIVDKGVGGTWAFPKDVGVGTSSMSLPGLELGRNYFYRVNTFSTTENRWISSTVKAIRTPDVCTSVLVKPQSLTVNLGKNAPPACTDSNYGVYVSWTNSGSGWWVDFSTDPNFGAGSFSSANVGGRINFITDGGNISPAMKFNPGVTYYWRMYYNILGAWVGGPSFSVARCTPAVVNSGLDYYIHMKDVTILPDKDAGNKRAIEKSLIDLVNNKVLSNHTWVEYSCPNYPTCWDFLVGESTKAGVSPAYSLAQLNTEGTSMGFVSDSGYAPCGADFVCALPLFLRSVNGQYPGYPTYNPNDEYQSFFAWIRIHCGSAGADAWGLCVPHPYLPEPVCYCGSYWQTRFKYEYQQFVAPGKLIQL